MASAESPDEPTAMHAVVAVHEMADMTLSSAGGPSSGAGTTDQRWPSQRSAAGHKPLRVLLLRYNPVAMQNEADKQESLRSSVPSLPILGLGTTDQVPEAAAVAGTAMPTRRIPPSTVPAAATAPASAHWRPPSRARAPGRRQRFRATVPRPLVRTGGGDAPGGSDMGDTPVLAVDEMMAQPEPPSLTGCPAMGARGRRPAPIGRRRVRP